MLQSLFKKGPQKRSFDDLAGLTKEDLVTWNNLGDIFFYLGLEIDGSSVGFGVMLKRKVLPQRKVVCAAKAKFIKKDAKLKISIKTLKSYSTYSKFKVNLKAHLEGCLNYSMELVFSKSVNGCCVISKDLE